MKILQLIVYAENERGTYFFDSPGYTSQAVLFPLATCLSYHLTPPTRNGSLTTSVHSRISLTCFDLATAIYVNIGVLHKKFDGALLYLVFMTNFQRSLRYDCPQLTERFWITVALLSENCYPPYLCSDCLNIFVSVIFEFKIIFSKMFLCFLSGFRCLFPTLVANANLLMQRPKKKKFFTKSTTISWYYLPNTLGIFRQSRGKFYATIDYYKPATVKPKLRKTIRRNSMAIGTKTDSKLASTANMQNHISTLLKTYQESIQFMRNYYISVNEGCSNTQKGCEFTSIQLSLNQRRARYIQ